MSFDPDLATQFVKSHERVARIVVCQTRGSAPRDPGTDMWVWPNGQYGTIGGGALEFRAVNAARRRLDASDTRIWDAWHALGPDLGQCCGGQVHLVFEVFDDESLPAPDQNAYIRCVKDAETTADIEALKSQYTAQNCPEIWLKNGVLFEQIATQKHPLWIWGAGHVGRALISVCAPLPDLTITWIDTDQNRFPSDIPPGIDPIIGADPHVLVPFAPADTQHVIVTYSHDLDFRICDAVLQHGFDFAGLIGSKTKWARFQHRLAALGHSAEQIHRITCPIGAPNLGKHPFAIAIGVANCLLEHKRDTETERNGTG